MCHVQLLTNISNELRKLSKREFKFLRCFRLRKYPNVWHLQQPFYRGRYSLLLRRFLLGDDKWHLRAIKKKKWQFLWQMSAMTQSRTLSRAFALSHLKVLSIKSSGTGKDHNRNPLLPVTWSDEQNKIKIPALQSYFAALRSKSTLGKTKWRKKNQKDELLCHPLYPTDFYLF